MIARSQVKPWQEWWQKFLLQGRLRVLALLVSVPPLCYRSSMKKIAVILPKLQMAGYSYTHMCPSYVTSNEPKLVHGCTVYTELHRIKLVFNSEKKANSR